MQLPRLIGVATVLAVALDLALGARALPDAALNAPGPWSGSALAAAGASGAPRLAFTSAGEGAIAWDVPGAARELALTDAGGAAAVPSSVHGSQPPRELALRSLAAATADGEGRVVLAGDAASAPAPATAALEASPAGPFGLPRPLGAGGGPLALANYLTGAVALASAAPAGATTRVQLRLQPPGATALGAPVWLAAERGAVTAVAVGLDWRGDALVAWQQGGMIYARERHTTGELGPLQRLGVSAGGPRLGALVSDDGRGIVAWTDETSPTHGEPRTARTRLAISGPGVRFGAARTVTTWSEPRGLRLGAGAMRLIRLANGRVVLGWTDRAGGALVVRVAPVTLTGLHTAVTVSDAGTDAQLCDLAPGARGEVLAVLEATSAGSGSGDGEIEAAVGVDTGAGVASFAPAELVAAGAASGDPTAAFDPVGDRPVVAWLTPAGQIRYAVRAAERLPR